MRLTRKNISHYLINKGFIDPLDIISGNYIVTQSQSRNAIFKVQQESSGLFVKQLINQDVQNSYLMQKDATSHYLIHQSKLYYNTATHIPKYYGYDPNHQILVTEFFSNTKNIHEIVYQEKKMSLSHAKAMATILSTFHFDIQEEIPKNTSLQFFNQLLPWILNIGNITSQDNTGKKNVVIEKIYEHKKLVKKIEKVAEKWQRTSLIHGDIKWMNFIVLNENDEEKVKLIDWEIADIGDPLWDVAGVFQSYLSAWVLSYKNETSHAHVQLQENAFLSIETIKPVLKYFWDSYILAAKTPQDKVREQLVKTLEYAAVRMIQTAFENNFSTPDLQPNSIRILQFCDHLLERPEQILETWGIIKKK